MRGPFARLRQQRADDRDLGTGLWRRSHDRMVRALDRYWQVLEDGASPSALSPEERNGLVHAGNVLADLVPEVRALCTRLQAAHPAEGDRIPTATAQAHRELSRAAHELAATAQAAAMARLGQGGTDSVGRHAERAIAHVRAAQERAPRG